MKLRGTKRQEFPLSVRKLALARCCKPDGIPKCEGPCGGTPLTRATGIIYEHIVPDGLGGEPTLENCKVHCKNCADRKTFEEDNPRMQKADRVFKKEYGLQPVRKKIESRGFGRSKPQNSASRPLDRKNYFRG